MKDKISIAVDKKETKQNSPKKVRLDVMWENTMKLGRQAERIFNKINYFFSERKVKAKPKL